MQNSCKDNILFSNEDEYKVKLEKLIKDGKDNLFIVADFDRTLTTHFGLISFIFILFILSLIFFFLI